MMGTDSDGTISPEKVAITPPPLRGYKLQTKNVRLDVSPMPIIKSYLLFVKFGRTEMIA